MMVMSVPGVEEGVQLTSLNKPYPVPTIWRSLSCPPRSSNVQSSNARYYGCKRLALVNNIAGCSQVATNGNGDPEPTALMKSVCLRCSRRSQEQGRISMVKYRNRREKKWTNPNHLEVSLFRFDTCCFGRVRWCSLGSSKLQ
ncbi:hypothetical protein PISMIDRAFT_324523 [Pisolithus microcarpus 441]|uniref:Uncharacterized protein n=1 Tax=Pisolithus microcarpus 441 TaxID=765257 RepID=A0A0C9Z902_9AGAM|nr:hypothetical protein PISMIDRAFT_324523 [Pisolithus microcarpus 441]